MVSTRQMSITVGPEAGSAGVNTNSGTSRMTSNSLSTQRQQSNNSPVNSILGDASDSNAGAFVPTQQTHLTDMPLEIFERIFQYTGYKEVSNMRLVSIQMNQICKTILNSTFTKLQTQLMKRFQNIKSFMPRRESARRSHPLSYECDIIETCCMRLSLLQMTFGRYIEHKHICFFPGAFLDEVYNVLNYIRTTPNPISRPYKITEELIDLSTMAMEYFKDHLEPSMPQFGLPSKGFFGKNSTTTRTSPKNCYLFDTASTSSAANSVSISTRSSQSSSMPSPPQSNMVLRKGIRKIKQGMKKYNNQLSVLRTDLRFCKRKSTDQAKQITELQNMLAEQQKQTLEYANRLDENDKKNDEMSSKISTLLQELNKCKIELHYYRSKSPATPICNNCGLTTLTKPPGNLLALIKQNINNSREEIINVIGKCSNLESKVQSHESSISQDLTTSSTSTSGAATAAANGMATVTGVTATVNANAIPTTTTTPINVTATSNSIAINAALLMHTNDNKDALNALHELKHTSAHFSPESIDSVNMNGESSSSSITNLTTPVRGDGICEILEKRWKLARNKQMTHMAGDWRCTHYDKTSVIESCYCDTLSTATSALAVATSTSIEPANVPQSGDSDIGTGGGSGGNSSGSAGTESSAKKSTNGSNSVILTVGTPRFYGKRKLDDLNAVDQSSDHTTLSMPNGTVSTSVSLNNPMTTTTATTTTTTNTNKNNATATNNLANSNLSDNYNKKARRVQNKLKIQTNNMNIKTRNK